MSVGVIIVAGGRGARLGAIAPKQLLDLGGRTMLRRSVEVFDAHPDVAQIVVVLPEDLVGGGAALVGDTRRPRAIVAGGARRQDSVRSGFAALDASVSLVLVHDAARPFADRALVDRVIAAAEAGGVGVPAVAARDTVKRVDTQRGVVRETLPREEIWLAQTPQGFRRDILAGVILASSGADATDEAMLAERAGHPVTIVEGDARNVKITTIDDLEAARTRVAGTPRVGTGYDLHRLVAGRRLVFAGVVVPFSLGPHGHSDGDVVCHALTDAILGAAGAGDIGRHFPDNDPQWKDAAGLDLLARAVSIVAARGWVVANVDITVILERPKLAPYLAEISAALARTLRVAPGDVSVKAKTNEGVDATGRGEAIAAHAAAILVAGAR